jgi:hypothetical protein
VWHFGGTVPNTHDSSKFKLNYNLPDKVILSGLQLLVTWVFIRNFICIVVSVIFFQKNFVLRAFCVLTECIQYTNKRFLFKKKERKTEVMNQLGL